MKKIIFTIAFLSLATANAQFVLDFESRSTQNINPSTDNNYSYIDQNPIIDGINASRNAVKVMEFSGCKFWASTIIDMSRETISFEEGKYFSVDFLSPFSRGMITIKFGENIEKDYVYSGKANTWRTAVFSFRGSPKSIGSNRIEIFFDVRNHRNPSKNNPPNSSEEVYWFDNLAQSKRKIRIKNI